MRGAEARVRRVHLESRVRSWEHREVIIEISDLITTPQVLSAFRFIAQGDIRLTAHVTHVIFVSMPSLLGLWDHWGILIVTDGDFRRRLSVIRKMRGENVHILG